MKRKTFILTIFLIVTLGGCGGIWQANPRAECRMAQLAFEGVLISLVDLQQAGQIGDDERVLIGRLAHAGRDLMAEWTQTVIETGQRPKAADAALAILRQLTELEMAKKGGD